MLFVIVCLKATLFHPPTLMDYMYMYMYVQ